MDDAKNNYTVTIRTTCRACALAIAGHAPALRTIVLAQVTSRGGAAEHINSAFAKIHNGDPLCCKEHGRAMDLSLDPGSGLVTDETRKRLRDQMREALAAPELKRALDVAIESLVDIAVDKVRGPRG